MRKDMAVLEHQKSQLEQQVSKTKKENEANLNNKIQVIILYTGKAKCCAVWVYIKRKYCY